MIECGEGEQRGRGDMPGAHASHLTTRPSRLPLLGAWCRVEPRSSNEACSIWPFACAVSQATGQDGARTCTGRPVGVLADTGCAQTNSAEHETNYYTWRLT
eukprot:7911220-Pyramimonas_sp.AAC.1